MTSLPLEIALLAIVENNLIIAGYIYTWPKSILP